MAVVAYARVSSKDQNLDAQLDILAEAGAEKVFAEKESGTSVQKRVELERCLDYVREGDILVVTRLDRLARSMTDLIGIMGRLEAKGVGFRCVLQNIDTTTAEGRLMFHLLGAFAEFETEIRKGRQREGIERAKQAGTYATVRPRRRKVSVEEIISLRESGMGATAIADQLGVNKTTVYRNVPDGWKPA